MICSNDPIDVQVDIGFSGRASTQAQQERNQTPDALPRFFLKLGIPAGQGRKFLEWHVGHKQVWQEFMRFAFDLRSAGISRCSAKLIMERVRWERTLHSGGTGEYKINNNYTSIYARILANKFPEQFKKFFEFRELRGKV